MSSHLTIVLCCNSIQVEQEFVEQIVDKGSHIIMKKAALAKYWCRPYFLKGRNKLCRNHNFFSSYQVKLQDGEPLPLDVTSLVPPFFPPALAEHVPVASVGAVVHW